MDTTAVSDQADVQQVVWSPGLNVAQWQLLECPVFEIFFGGARGGGKTDGVLGDWLSHANRYGEHAIGLMIRRSRTELVETIERSKQIYGPLGWTYNEVEHMWRDQQGARLRFAYLERDADAERYQGHSYTRLYVEEIGNFPSPAPVLKLMATLRSGAGVPVGLRATGNPGGPGHHWVKARYIDPAPRGNEIITDPISKLERVFIPSKVDNNKHIDIEAYKQRLRGSGPSELVRAWLDGDWSVTLGAFFDCWDSKRHVIDPFPVPKEWMRFRSMDWGSASPFSVGWWAVVQDDYPLIGETTRILPRGCMVRYREWYGMKKGQPNVGMKLVAENVGAHIEAKEKDEPISYGVLDPSAFAEDGGPSIAERIARGSGGKVWFRRADNTRVASRGAMGGWDQLRARLIGDAEGRPQLVTFSTCIDLIRTLPFLQHDPDRIEDVMTDSEDHAADEVRYACMSRPFVPTRDERPREVVTGYKVSRDTAKPGDWLCY
jgi:Terminase large subunit, T4likevirus-type, N-terminal